MGAATALTEHPMFRYSRLVLTRDRKYALCWQTGFTKCQRRNSRVAVLVHVALLCLRCVDWQFEHVGCGGALPV